MDVKRGPILFRCDATPELGYERFYQCLSLAAAMQRRRRGTYFQSYLDPLSLATTIHRANNEWIAAETPVGSSDDLKATVAEIRRLNAAAVVVASSEANAEYLAGLNETGTRVICIDPEPTVKYPSKLVVNPFLAPGPKPYRVERGTQLLLGQRFALVRGVFRRQRTIRATEQPGPYRALVALGDDDAADQTLIRTEQLLNMPGVDRVSVVLRTHHPRYEELKDFAEASKGRVEVLTEAKELMTRLVRCHFAVTSGDSWALELCCVGIPQLMLPSETRHLLNAKRMDDEGVGTFLGAAPDVTEAALGEAVALVLNDPIERMGMTRCGRRLIDGRGGDRIVNGLEIVLHTPRMVEEVRAAA
ncbi:MAG: polysaccharide biosynthesis protein [Fimbriiglobus sp.]|nr:polysaccharide biosynthesis protein [Fimbriiglobus sp.]